jgi:hypothetical protein
VVGDSNAAMYGRFFQDFCKANRCELNMMGVGGYNLLPHTGPETNAGWVDVMRHLESARPDIVVLGFLWSTRLENEPERLDVALRQIMPHTQRIVVVNQQPVLPQDSRRDRIRAGVRPPFVEERAITERRELANGAIARSVSDKVAVVDAAVLFTNPDGSIRTYDEQGNNLFDDEWHLSLRGSELVGATMVPHLQPPTAQRRDMSGR